MIGNAPHSILTGVPGWEHEAEQHYLAELARQVAAKGTIIEIGAEYGMSASIFCQAAPATAKIISIDIFQGDMLKWHRANLAEAGFKDRSQQIVGDSRQVVKDWTGKIDLLWIDGDHSYGGAKADIDNWTPFVKVGGVVAFHDCACATNTMPHFLHFEVTRAVSEWCLEKGTFWKPLKSVDSILAFERVKAG